jgi:site-specific DNA-methyltransferase (adenine-specific)
MAVNIEDAGWEIRDQIMWVYGSGFPKSLDVSKAIDKAAGAEGAVIGERRFGKTSTGQSSGWNDNAVAATGRQDIREPATDAAKQWHGWGTALKPALEPITMARKPLEGTVAANVLEHGTGAINVDGCRVGVEPSPSALMCASDRVPSSCKPGEYGDTIQNRITPERWQEARPGEQLGRWPANLIHDGSDEVVGLFPEQANGGSAARFFYCAKTSKKERGDGNNHPTVKPQKLMEYLIKLVTPPGGIILDPFAGSGSTGIAAKRLGFDFVLIEMDHEYCKIIERRLNG